MTVKSYNGYVPYLFLASFLATWFRIRVILAITIVFMIILISITGASISYDGGGYGRIGKQSVASYNSVTLLRTDSYYGAWKDHVCDQSPTIYLQPFSFTFVATNTTSGVTISSSSTAVCPFPSANTIYRLVILSLGFVTFIGLYFQSIMSYFARTILLSYALLFFSIFVLDTNQAITGFSSCHDNFYGTGLGQSIQKYNVNISCQTRTEVAIILFDFFLSLLCYLLFECWGMCADLYDEKVDRVSVITKRSTIQTEDVENPMQSRAVSKPKKNIVSDNIDYTPYEPERINYAPYEPNQINYSPYESHDNNDYTPYDAKHKSPKDMVSVETSATRSTITSTPTKSASSTPYASYSSTTPSPNKKPMATPPRKPPITPNRVGSKYLK